MRTTRSANMRFPTIEMWHTATCLRSMRCSMRRNRHRWRARYYSIVYGKFAAELMRVRIWQTFFLINENCCATEVSDGAHGHGSHLTRGVRHLRSLRPSSSKSWSAKRCIGGRGPLRSWWASRSRC